MESLWEDIRHWTFSVLVGGALLLVRMVVSIGTRMQHPRRNGSPPL
jgi:hypothetical protein